MRVGVYAGSFDPISKGHQDIILRSLEIVDKVIVLVGDNPKKKYWFQLEEREAMLREVFAAYGEKIEVRSHQGLLINFMKEVGAKIILRGLRAASDFDYEMGYALANRELADYEVDTIFLPASRDYLYLSSTGVREIAINGGNIGYYVDERLVEKVEQRAKELVV